ncbi:MAG: DUF2237 family protein [Planctomycetales bacterium]|nr:DUF2237 family protein [Planctomycetales bacterium]
MPSAKNVLGTDLQTCCESPVTGYYRDGCCNTGPGDHQWQHMHLYTTA